MAVAIDRRESQQYIGSPWWVLILWGIAAIMLGFYLITQPLITAVLLLQVVALFWLIGGIFDLIGAVMERGQGWTWRVVGAVLSILAGLAILANPILGTIFTVQLLFIFIAFSSLVNGVINLLGGRRSPKSDGSRWSWGSFLLGAFQIILGLFLLANPFVTMLTLVPVIGIIAIIHGLVVIALGFRVRRLHHA